MTSECRPRSANDRLKERFGDLVASSLIAATVVHFLVFQMWPEMTVSDWSTPAARDLAVVELPTIPLPAPPDPLPRPVRPVISESADVTATIEVVDFDRAGELQAPAPPPNIDSATDARGFVVLEVMPRLINPDEFQRALLRAYPQSLRDAGIGGTVSLDIHVDEEGRALEGRVRVGSGYVRLDEAALGLIDVMRFAPAVNRDRRVAVWVTVPIEFRSRRP